jgi:hypothetical protein
MHVDSRQRISVSYFRTGVILETYIAFALGEGYISGVIPDSKMTRVKVWSCGCRWTDTGSRLVWEDACK